MKDKENSKEKKSFRESTFWEYLQVFTVAFVLVFGFMRPFVVEAFKIPSASMEDTLLIGDRILVAKFMYGIKIPFTDYKIMDFQEPKVGDVFVFKPPAAAGKTQNFIKRIVGVAGDVIYLREGNLYRNGKRVEGEEYVKRSSYSRGSPQNMPPYKIPEGYVFAMGDNRDHSSDSRVWGPVPVENIKGQAFIKYWSWNSEGDWLHKIRFSRIGRPVK
ncbi:signal peptidase I [Candidatus Poribacteria bacterium]|nr:signal peptidase I [Candidatus Poribacteria bacterium]